ncbi:putative 6-hydroxy-D-nicotine oxidase [Aspergillus bombycis]|uniref:Putative 6-hydroxy-D-nicotine oxidase n=1 Tax=Aspergillus bombycis TaxID=109264 RepID=A0A1F8AGY1_9EURO|nr:putative 6-hydroxy-D-nicotine oxidase [Aspergillus bombycis]OGM50971.1 putative 6-hydroxy-D-nicotine oxidase [Aspergillus bombycis]
MRVGSTILPLAGSLLVEASSVSAGCSALKGSVNSAVFNPNSPVYEYEAQNFWSNTEIMSPGCVFRPQSSAQLAEGVKALVDANAQFAVRGGGHMGIRGSNNIDDGVLVVMSNLTTLELSEDQSIVSVGPSHRWEDVYAYLADYGLAAAGGRLGPVGVPGLLLAGGVNFYGNQVGWSCNTVVNYEIVLADGSVVEANKTHYSDLFWALKGGSSNFGLVTRFDLETIKSPKVWAGTHTVSAEYVDQFLEAAATYASNISDPKTHIVPALVPGDELLASVILFYDSEDTSYPEIFKPFTDIPAISSTLDFKTLSEFAAETGAMVVPHIKYRCVCRWHCCRYHLRRAAPGHHHHQHHVLRAPAQAVRSDPRCQHLHHPAGLAADRRDWMKASEDKGGNALGLDSSKIYLCYAEVVEWIGSSYDDIVAQWVEETTYAINNATQKAGLYDAFNYMGDAAGFQSIFPGYGEENVAKLQTIAKKYDPNQVFQTLMPGGFKVY